MTTKKIKEARSVSSSPASWLLGDRRQGNNNRLLNEAATVEPQILRYQSLKQKPNLIPKNACFIHHPYWYKSSSVDRSDYSGEWLFIRPKKILVESSELG
jgi:hypothetical protein